MIKEAIQEKVRLFLIENIFNSKDAGDLKDETALISSRLMDSIVALKLVSFIEENFAIEIEANEIDQDHLDTLTKIVNFIIEKQNK